MSSPNAFYRGSDTKIRISCQQHAGMTEKEGSKK